MRFPALFFLALPVFSAAGWAEPIPPSAAPALFSTELPLPTPESAPFSTKSPLLSPESALLSAKSPRLSSKSALPSEQGERMDSPHGGTPDVAVAHRQARIESLFRALEQVLAPVTDEASADAAAPAVLQLSNELCGVREESHRISERGREAEKAMDAWNLRHGKSFTRLTEKSFGKALNLLLDAPACHGSAALEKALLQLFDVLEEREPDASPAS